MVLNDKQTNKQNITLQVFFFFLFFFCFVLFCFLCVCVLEFYDPVNNEVMSSRSANSGTVPRQERPRQ